MEKYILLAIFGIAMAHLEGVVVVYLRKILGINNQQSNKESLKNFTKRYVFIEKTREIATIVMLVTLALLVGEDWLDTLIIFLWTFAFWDLFYYLSLYLLIKWPPKLTTIDVLFLILLQFNTSSLDCTCVVSNWGFFYYHHSHYNSIIYFHLIICCGFKLTFMLKLF